MPFTTTPSPLASEVILASAGSGKTFQLTNRYLALMGAQLLANEEPRPEQILAATFSRKAAGEFFTETLSKLADGARNDEAALKIAGPKDTATNPFYPILSKLTASHYQKLLEVFIAKMPQLFLSTLDAFFGNILRNFPSEFGLSGNFEVLSEHDIEVARQETLAAALSSSPGDEGNTLLDALKLATLQNENLPVESAIARFIQKFHSVFLVAPEVSKWGNPAQMWPNGCPWLPLPNTTLAEESKALLLNFEREDSLYKDEKARTAVITFIQELVAECDDYHLGDPLPKRLSNLLPKVVEELSDIEAGSALITINRRKLQLPPPICQRLLTMAKLVIGTEIEQKCRTTRGIWALINAYENHYHRRVRSQGKLTFADIQNILSGVDNLTHHQLTLSPAHAREENEAKLLDISYRLDGRYKHWLLDEFQDTSFPQWSVLQQLIDEVMSNSEEARSYFQVGDTKQAIYAWRGGETKLFDEVRDRYEVISPGLLTTRHLDVSWRSGYDVINPVNAIFGNSDALAELGVPPSALERWPWQEHQVAKNNQSYPGITQWLETAPLEKGKSSSNSEKKEAIFALTLALLEEIQPVKNGLSCVILVQQNKTGQDLVDYVRQHTQTQLRIQSDASQKVASDSPVTIALISLLRLAAHPSDSFSLKHLEMTPLQELIDKEEWQWPEVSYNVRSQIHQKGFEETLRLWMNLIRKHGLLKDEYSWDRLEELALAARFFDESYPRNFQQFFLFIESHRKRENTSTSVITVMSIHQSKGLTYDMAILPELDGSNFLTARDGIVTALNEDTREIQWICDLPNKLTKDADPMLRNLREKRDAETAYESLCKFYVALTRARYANYLITNPPTKTANFARLLNLVWSEEPEKEINLGETDCILRFESEEAHSNQKWWTELNPSEPIVAQPLPEIPHFDSRARPFRRSPSQMKRNAEEETLLFSQRSIKARLFGTQLHEYLKTITWIDDNPPVPPKEIADQVHKLFDDPLTQTVFQKPQLKDGENIVLWREKSFELVLNQKWISETLNRAVIFTDTQGQALRAQLWDFKADEVTSQAEAEEQGQCYNEQLALYKQALARLFELPQDAITTALLFTNGPYLVKLN